MKKGKESEKVFSMDETVRLEVLENPSSMGTGKNEKWRDAGPITMLPSENDSAFINNLSKAPKMEKKLMKEKTKLKELTSSVKNLLGGRQYYEYRHSSDKIDTNLLILLHGAGDSHIPYHNLAQTMMLPQTASLSISASIPETFVKIPFDLGYTWFEETDYLQTGLPLPPNHPKRIRSLEKAIHYLKRVLSCLIVDNGWIPERIFILGFSCGACLAMETALDLFICDDKKQNFLSNRPLGGIICIAGGIKFNRYQSSLSPAKNWANLSEVLLVVGQNDKIFTPSEAEMSSRIYNSFFKIEKVGTKERVKIHVQSNKAHSMISSHEEVHAIMSFLSVKLVREMGGFNASRNVNV